MARPMPTLAPVGEFYLAGGTALALRHGHRRSVDFDFFRQDSVDTEALDLTVLDPPGVNQGVERFGKADF